MLSKHCQWDKRYIVPYTTSRKRKMITSGKFIHALRHPKSTLGSIKRSWQKCIDTPQARIVGNARHDDELSQAIAKLSEVRIAIQAHIFYEDLAPEIATYVENIPVDFDLFVTTDSQEKIPTIRKAFENNPRMKSVEIMAAGNRGRDVLPFIAQMSPHINEYDIICHAHTKRSLHFDKGDEWRTYLLENVLGGKDLILDIVSELSSDSPIGLMYPKTFEPIAPFVVWGSNRTIAETALEAIDFDIILPDDIIFPAGNMFWARTDAVKELFDDRLLSLWDESTDGAENGTVMHAIERLWTYVADANGYETVMTAKPGCK